jgi:hypothetical protein
MKAFESSGIAVENLTSHTKQEEAKSLHEHAI